LKAGHGKYYQTRTNTEPQVTQQSQSNIDVDFEQKRWALHQSFFRSHGEGGLSGSESRMTFSYKRKFQLDQTVSFYHQEASWDWFLRTFLKYNPFPGWTFNASFQTFKGNSYKLVNATSYRSEIDVFAPEQHSAINFFDPYTNLSFGASKLLQFSEKLNGLVFLNVANVFDFRNETSLSYNRDYSNYTSNYLTRRSVYAGLIFNLVND
jgi:hypothetical protein